MAAGLPTAILVEVEFTAGVWTDIATHVVGDSIEIRVGRESAASDIQPGTLSLTLDNADGQWTPDNPTATRYPNWVEGKRIRVQVTKGTTSTRFVGRITSIVPDFPVEPAQSRVQVTAIDLLGEMQRIALRDFQRAAHLSDTSFGWPMWPLDDSDSNKGCFPIQAAGVGGTPAKRLTVRNVTPGSGSVDFAADSSLAPNGATSYVELTDGKGLWHAAGASAGSTVEDWGLHFRTYDGQYGEVAALTSGPRTNPGSAYLLLTYTSSGLRLESWKLGALDDSTPYFDIQPGWHHLAVDYDTGDLDVYLDGVLVDTLVVGTLPLGGYTNFSIGGDIVMSAANLVVGNPNVIGARALLSVASTTTQAADDLELIARLSDLGAAIAFSTATDRAVSTFDTEGKSAFEVLLSLANVESGIVFHEYSTSATQTIRILSRPDSRPTTAALTVDAELDLSGGPAVSRDLEGTVVTATAQSPITKATYTATGTSTVGAASAEVEAMLFDDNDLQALAQDVVARSTYARLRVTQMTVDLSTAATDLYASFFGLSLGERVRLTNLPSTYFGVTYMDGYVEGWTERPGVTGYEVTFDLSPADAPPEGLWDDSTYGRWGFGDGVATNSSSATVGATSVQFQWTGGLTLSTSAGDYPMDLDWNGERVTVTAAPAGGSSPQTLTLTRGVAPTVARAHNAGESVDIWNAARWAM